MPRNFIFFFITVLFLESWNVSAQTRDTVLVKMESNPFFYNVLKSNNGEIFSGTSMGIFKVSGKNLDKVDERVGYIGIDQKGELTIEKEGIKNYVERKFLHLLPFPDRVREEFHAGVDNDFYIVSNGVLYSYEIVPYKHTFDNSSVRTISSNFVGTYSGVFFRNQKMGSPIFSDGYIREFEGKAFICYHDLIIREIPRSGDSIIIHEDIELDFKSQVEDVFYSSTDKRFYLATISKLVRLSPDLRSYDLLYQTDPGSTAFLGEMKNSIFLASNDKIITYSLIENSIDTLYHHSEPIMGGYTSVRNVYFLTENGFYIFNSDGSVKKLIALKSAHTVLPISDTEQIISTNSGLWYFNSTSRELSELIPGVEFNKKALHLEGDQISAGSIKGLYTFSISSIPELIQRNQAPDFNSSLSEYKEEISIAVILFTVVLGVLLRELIKERRKNQYYEEQLEEVLAQQEDTVSEPKVTRENIEEFIRERLAEASLKSIMDQFQITTSQVYSILKPDKPGTIIQQLRKEKVMEMKKNKASTKDIALSTGLSPSYIRKINDSGEVENESDSEYLR